MPRIKELVRIATLARHFQDGLVSAVEIIDDGERWSVRVHYNERAEGPKTRFLTSQRKPGPKQYAAFDTVWRVLTEHGITQATIRKIPSENR
jgi:hypothetical protein